MKPSRSKSTTLAAKDHVTIPFPEASAQSRESLCKAVLESVEQGIIVWTADGYCAFVNSRYRDMLGQGINYLQEGMHRSVYFEKMVERGEITPEAVANIEADLNSRQPFKLERKLGNGVEIAVYIRPMDAGGHVVSYTDITESKRNQLILSQAIERAETAEHKARDALQLERERRAETRSLAELGDWLQSCKSIDELYEIVRQAMRGYFAESSGQLFIYSNSRDVLDGAVCWGDTTLLRNVQPQDCWGLRRGRTFLFGDGVVNFPCTHVLNHQDKQPEKYVCLPIIAQGDTVGLLNIIFNKKLDEKDDFKSQIAFAQKCAEQISVAVANVKLRDELHEQSTRDPLTGLYNRRYFIDRCRSAISLVQREKGSLALISFDADNFKSYNDQYGHDAGDYLLCTVGSLISRYFDDDETCCRIGGEEFSVLLPDASLEKARSKAEELIQLIASHDFSYRGTPLPHVTISAGVATFPGNSNTLVELCKAADLAMYAAKEKGKNRVCIPD
ncbi:MAG: diguanylate cyclase [Pseudomonadota bacterium]